ncbi:MAG: ribbon-helix-helix protein, CopG family [Deltaproteobacteria bacterium]|nr:MAG: ribbon-helix-helix protein, CopG family [Deltaproteobacteria bacterium]
MTLAVPGHSDHADTTGQPAPASSVLDAEAGTAAPLTKLSVEELQARYLAEVGRPTRSSNARYLVWKIREARRGRVPVGPVGRRASGEAAVEHKVLPLRLPTDTVAALDEVWRRHGLKSRMDLFRQALAAYLTGLGEEDAAASVRGA